MNYTIGEVASIAGVSTRTLRYYDEIDLLKPKMVSDSGYRLYGQEEIDLLQQILLYRELDLPLEKIKEIVNSSEFDSVKALKDHLLSLEKKKSQIDLLINNVERSILAKVGEISMTNKEKFEGFKRELINDNEEKYGKEIRGKYGEAVVAKSNAKMMGLNEKEYQYAQDLSQNINENLKEALIYGDAKSEQAQKVCQMHQEWIQLYWPDYTKEAHFSLVQGYVEDPRFKKYYDSIAPGAAEFLLEAMKEFLKGQ